ncbi:MAG: hypothetical protein JWN95_1552 [Frankiales bacterium]|nr:hypothetical protein [Frankiales bacterium]
MHRHHPIRWILVLITLGLAAYFLTPRVNEARDAIHALNGSSVGWLVIAVLGELVSLVVFTMVTYSLLSRANRPPFGKLFRIDLATIALSHAVPGGSAAGTALGYGLLAEAGVGGVEAAFVKVSQSLISGIMLQAVLVVALVGGAASDRGSSTYLATGIAGGVIMIATLGFGWMLLGRPYWIASLAAATFGRIPKLSRDRVQQIVLSLEDRLRGLVADHGRFFWICAWSAGNWVFDLVSLWASLRAFGPSCSVVELTIAFAAVQVVASLPLSPGGLGLVEGSLVGILGSFGTSSSVAVLGVLTWRLWNFWLPLPIGAGAYGLILLSRRGPRQPRRPPGRSADRPSDRPADRPADRAPGRSLEAD